MYASQFLSLISCSHECPQPCLPGGPNTRLSVTVSSCGHQHSSVFFEHGRIFGCVSFFLPSSYFSASASLCLCFCFCLTTSSVCRSHRHPPCPHLMYSSLAFSSPPPFSPRLRRKIRLLRHPPRQPTSSFATPVESCLACGRTPPCLFSRSACDCSRVVRISGWPGYKRWQSFSGGKVGRCACALSPGWVLRALRTPGVGFQATLQFSRAQTHETPHWPSTVISMFSGREVHNL